MKSKNSVIKKEFAPDTIGHVIDAKYFYFAPDERNTSELQLLCGGYERCANDFHINRNKFPFYAMIFVVKGKGIYKTNNVTYSLQYGSMIFIDKGSQYVLEADKLNPLEHFVVIFLGNKAKKLYQLSEFQTVPVRTSANSQTITILFEEILKIGFSKPPFANELCSNYLTNIILSQADKSESNQIRSESYDSFLACKKYLEENYVKLTSSAELADECCFDIRYIARLFKEFAGIRPYDYLMKLKTDKAVNLLITSNLSMKNIAYITGFTDPYHFSRVFKKRLNISPNQYRKNLNLKN
ncbi:MAG: AraC family transcriptional regulator [Sedimentisphaeraceae bacterium JB056]